LVARLALLPQFVPAEGSSELLDRLVRAYPDALSGHDDKTITWRDGTVMPVDDGVSDKSFDQMPRNASILDQMRLPYPAGCGRGRARPFPARTRCRSRSSISSNVTASSGRQMVSLRHQAFRIPPGTSRQMNPGSRAPRSRQADFVGRKNALKPDDI
jgi:hypothetical protein